MLPWDLPGLRQLGSSRRPGISYAVIMPWIVLAVAVLTFGTALLAFITSLRASRKLDDQSGTLSAIQVHVDGRLDSLSERVEQLVIALVRAGEPVPPDPNGKM